MTRQTSNGTREVVRLSPNDWAGILAVAFTILVTIFIAGITIESRLTEVLTRQEQLQIRIERVEAQIDMRGDS
tara:strand:+ start:7586 stop:7804 length:219 start_codon:yes stop_codon:yes gene_type:complete